MRKLTIKREKSFVGCLGIMKVYIEDAERGDENCCNDCYQLSEGNEDISLSGRNKFDPAAGNAFQFNGNESENAESGRKNGVKRVLIILIAFVIIGFIIGGGITMAVLAILDGQEKTFTAGEMCITLNKGFEEQRSMGYDAVFVSRNVDIIGLKNEFSSFGSSLLSASEYAKFLMESDAISGSEVVTENGLTYYVFNRVASNNQEYRYFVYTYKTDSAYWQLYFTVKENKADKYADDIARWAGSVIFN